MFPHTMGVAIPDNREAWERMLRAHERAGAAIGQIYVPPLDRQYAPHEISLTFSNEPTFEPFEIDWIALNKEFS